MAFGCTGLITCWSGTNGPQEASAHTSQLHSQYCDIFGLKLDKVRGDDTSLMAESKEELKSLLTKVREESGKVGLKLNIPKLR